MLYPLLGILSVRTALWMYLIYQGRLPARVSYPLFTGEALLLFSVFWYFYTEESEKEKTFGYCCRGNCLPDCFAYRH